MSLDTTPFLAAIRQHKSDDLPRLVFADYLEETNEPDNVARAEFIRLGVEVCKVKMKSLRWHAIHARIQELYDAVGRDRAMFVFSGTTSADWTHYREGSREQSALLDIARLCPAWFRRGFVVEVHMTHDCFLRNAAAIFRANPVEKVVLTDREPATGTDPTSGFRWLRGDPEMPVRRTPCPLIARRLFYSLREFPESVRGTIGCWYPSPDETTHALSAACVRYGESLADLQPVVDPLPPGTGLCFDPVTRRYSRSNTPTAILL